MHAEQTLRTLNMLYVRGKLVQCVELMYIRCRNYHRDGESEERRELLHDLLVPVLQQRRRARQVAGGDDVRLVEHVLVSDNHK